jgi:hypothetical protein
MIARALTRMVLLLAATAATVPALGQQSQPLSGQGSAPPPGNLRESSGPLAPGALYIVEQPGNTLLATEYIGRSVYGPDKRQVGTVSDLLVDSTGRVTGVAIEVGGLLGFGAKEIALAFEAVYPVREDEREFLLVDMTKDQLAVAPTFKRSR